MKRRRIYRLALDIAITRRAAVNRLAHAAYLAGDANANLVFLTHWHKHHRTVTAIRRRAEREGIRL